MYGLHTISRKLKMHNFVYWILLTVVLITDCSDAVPNSDFIPFGLSNGDVQLVKDHRAASSAIRIPPKFHFFDEIYDNIYVSSAVCTMYNNFKYACIVNIKNRCFDFVLLLTHQKHPSCKKSYGQDLKKAVMKKM